MLSRFNSEVDRSETDYVFLQHMTCISILREVSEQPSCLLQRWRTVEEQYITAVDWENLNNGKNLNANGRPGAASGIVIRGVLHVANSYYCIPPLGRPGRGRTITFT